MHEFFHGWRRKVGVVSLVMACVFASGWARSLRKEEVAELRVNATRLVQFHSANGMFVWKSVFCSNPMNKILKTNRFAYSSDMNPSGFGDPRPGMETFCGFACGHMDFTLDGYQQLVVKVHYWVVVIPLTLLSAYLLLWNPRKRTGKGHA